MFGNLAISNDGHALLIDFGLSKQGVKGSDFTSSLCGSVFSLAPEMLKKTGHSRSVDWYLLGVLLYEMLVGIPPYFHKDKEKLFANIDHELLEVPNDMSSETLDLIVALLNRNPNKRLGPGPGDAEEIKQHHFFKSINWHKALKGKLKPPKPSILPIKETDINFDKFKDSEFDEDNKMKR